LSHFFLQKGEKWRKAETQQQDEEDSFSIKEDPLPRYIHSLWVRIYIRVARFFLVQNTKTGKNIPNYHKIYQVAVKYLQWP
jgi:hypothetical protein